MDKLKLVSSTRIYLDARRLMDEVLDITPNFPKSYKHTIGNRLHDLSVDVMHTIVRAYMTHDRQKRIDLLCELQSSYEILRTLLRIAGEREWIKGKGRHAHIVELLDALGRQSTAWKNSLVKAPKPGSKDDK